MPHGAAMALSPKEILSNLQWEFLSVFFIGAPPFFLTGGTALSAFYLHHRYLDLFTLDSARKLAVESFPR